jgi:Family of unknown function (DUF5681)
MKLLTPRIRKKQPPTIPPSSVYKVGKSKPPIETRFRPGHSGNPKGRPKGAKNKSKPVKQYEAMSAIIQREGRRILKLTENGRPISLPMIAVIARAMMHKAIKCDHRAQRDFLRLCESAESIERQRSLDAQREAADHSRKIGANDTPWYHKSSVELREEIQQEAEELGFQIIWRPREGRDPQ